MSALARIEAYKRDEIAERKAACALADMEARAKAASPTRGFLNALQKKSETGQMALIAEIKKASPSKGLIRENFDPPALACAYQTGGAACLSVLTDAPSFQGHDSYLSLARNACTLPVLRKDFMLDPWQIVESRALGADAILIILASVDDALAAELLATAREYGMDALIETHNAEELDRALQLDAPLLGVNNRNLKTFETSLSVFEDLAPRFVESHFAIAESGIATHQDVIRVRQAGARGILVGESLMRQSDVAAATKSLLNGPALT